MNQRTPHYDPEQDRIVGAIPNTIEWFHEQRHQKQFYALPWLYKFMENLSIYSYAFAASFLLVYFALWTIFGTNNVYVFYLFGAAYIPMTVIKIILEVDATIFGWIYYTRYKRLEKK
jgi:uncharacterized phage infection (PIP) family protein YhgE